MKQLDSYGGLGLVIFGVSACAVGLIIAPYPFETGYVHTVSPYEGNDLPESEFVIEYQNLTSQGQYEFLRGLHDKSGESIVYDIDKRPSDFTYSHDIHSYVIMYKSNQYRLVASVRSIYYNWQDILGSIVIIAAGLAAVGVGSRSLMSH